VTQLCPGPVDTEFVERARMGRTLPFQFTKISAERCARAAVRGFDAGRAMVIPGLMMKFILLLGALTPRFLLRLIYRPVAAVIRRM
ncbi:MAG: short-chain dehydrogenase, partial [Myxococcales bacterium]|nr:short-chain dehydrogenase [Myxococcales bacterium]